MGIRERSAERARRIVGHHAATFEEADQWDLDFWLSQTPEQRLSALVAIRRDVAAVQRARHMRGQDRRRRRSDGIHR